MKGAIQEIVGQESGFIREHGQWYLDNWSSNMTEYYHDRRRVRRVKNVLQYMVNSDAIEVIDDLSQTWRDDNAYEEYKGRYYRPKYNEYANPVSMAELDVEGCRYVIGDMVVIVPDGWV